MRKIACKNNFWIPPSSLIWSQYGWSAITLNLAYILRFHCAPSVTIQSTLNPLFSRSTTAWRIICATISPVATSLLMKQEIAWTHLFWKNWYRRTNAWSPSLSTWFSKAKSVNPTKLNWYRSKMSVTSWINNVPKKKNTMLIRNERASVGRWFQSYNNITFLYLLWPLVSFSLLFLSILQTTLVEIRRKVLISGYICELLDESKVSISCFRKYRYNLKFLIFSKIHWYIQALAQLSPFALDVPWKGLAAFKNTLMHQNCKSIQ